MNTPAVEEALRDDFRTERLRCFLALDLEPELIVRLAEAQRALRGEVDGFRWSRSNGIHLTLHFLGSVARPRLVALEAALRAELVGQRALLLRVQGLGAFPTARRPRVLWAGVQGEGLGDLAQHVRAVCRALGFPDDDKPFEAHVTLARSARPRGGGDLTALLRAHSDERFGTTKARDLVLYRSETHPDGARYTPLWRLALLES